MTNGDYNVSQRYQFILNKTNLEGLNEKEIEKYQNLYVMVKNVAYLKEMAYKPTGIALGYPLPNQTFQKSLNSIGKTIEKFLQKKNPSKPFVFAYVPPESYHITIVNFKHFDKDTEIKTLSFQHFENARTIINKRFHESIQITFNKIIVTPEGRLIVCGYPVNHEIYQLRDDLLELFTESNVSRVDYSAHIKLGHLLISLSKSDLNEMVNEINNLTINMNCTMTFNDVFTPYDRIAFKKNE